MNTVRTIIPNAILNVGLRGLRLPLTTLEIITHNTNSNWAPALLFESFEAEAKKIVGSVLRQDDLVREGRFQKAKVGDLTEAEELEARAEVKRREADEVMLARKQSAEEARLRAESQAAQRERQVEREAEAKKRALSDRARRQKQGAADGARRRGNAVAAQERRAERTSVTEELAASTRRTRAVGAAKKAKNLETALETKKAQRRTA